MARSTRNKIIAHFDSAMNHHDSGLKQLQNMDEEQAGQSPYIEVNLPMLVDAYKRFKGLLMAFREGL